MLSISLILALVIDRVVPSLQSFRLDYRIQVYTGWFVKQPWCRSVPPRLTPYFLILLPVILVVIFSKMMQFSGLFELVFNTLIAFICLKPKVLNEEVDEVIKSLSESSSCFQSDVDNIFNESNRGLYSPVLWMVVAGPVWVVAYRFLVGLLSMAAAPSRDSWQKDVNRIIAWIEWLPALISSYLFMLCGSFEAGSKASRQIPLSDENIAELNETRLRKIGLAVVEVDMTDNLILTADIMRRIRGMLLRTLVVWLVLALIIDYWL